MGPGYSQGGQAQTQAGQAQSQVQAAGSNSLGTPGGVSQPPVAQVATSQESDPVKSKIDAMSADVARIAAGETSYLPANLSQQASAGKTSPLNEQMNQEQVKSESQPQPPATAPPDFNINTAPTEGLPDFGKPGGGVRSPYAGGAGGAGSNSLGSNNLNLNSPSSWQVQSNAAGAGSEMDKRFYGESLAAGSMQTAGITTGGSGIGIGVGGMGVKAPSPKSNFPRSLSYVEPDEGGDGKKPVSCQKCNIL